MTTTNNKKNNNNDNDIIEKYTTTDLPSKEEVENKWGKIPADDS